MKERRELDADEEARWGQWMAAAQRGDGEAYDRLLHSILPRLRSFVAARTRDPGIAEDVVQNVLLKIHKARHTYRQERPFGPWLRAIARNTAIDALRARGVKRKREVPLSEIELADTSNPEPGLPRGLSPVLERALAELPAGQREALELMHLRQLSSEEAARELGISPVAVRVRAHRAYKALRGKLRREEL